MRFAILLQPIHGRMTSGKYTSTAGSVVGVTVGVVVARTVGVAVGLGGSEYAYLTDCLVQFM